MQKTILAILPISIGGRLTTNSIIDGYKQNGCDVIIYDELFDTNLPQILKKSFNQIVGYDFSPLKIKIDNNLDISLRKINTCQNNQDYSRTILYLHYPNYRNHTKNTFIREPNDKKIIF